MGEKKSFPLESQNVESSNLEDNPIRTTIEMVGNDTELEADPLGSRENSPIKKQGSHDLNPDEPGVQINTESMPSMEEEKLSLQLQWIEYVQGDSVVKIPKSQAKQRQQLVDESLNSYWNEPENKGFSSSFESLPSPSPSTRKSS